MFVYDFTLKKKPQVLENELDLDWTSTTEHKML